MPLASDKATHSHHDKTRIVKRAKIDMTCTWTAFLERQIARARLPAQSSCLLSASLVYVSIQPRTMSLDDWPASRHVTGTDHVCYPLRSSKRRLEPDSMSRAIILTVSRVWRSPDPSLMAGVPGHAVIPRQGCLSSRTRWRR